MFYHISMERDIILHPRYFGPELFKKIEEKLKYEVEGKCTGTYGYVISITVIEHVGSGLIVPQEGCVKFPIKFKGIVFRPFKGEVLDGIVSQVNKVGIFVEIGPLSCFISHLSMPLNLKYCSNGNQQCYRSKEEDMIIGERDTVRLKLIGIRFEADRMFGVGTLMDDFLGLINN